MKSRKTPSRKRLLNLVPQFNNQKLMLKKKQQKLRKRQRKQLSKSLTCLSCRTRRLKRLKNSPELRDSNPKKSRPWQFPLFPARVLRLMKESQKNRRINLKPLKSKSKVRSAGKRPRERTRRSPNEVGD